jgi:two-component system, NtrC family, sensor histidine kinase HydH
MHTRSWPRSKALGRARQVEQMGVELAHQLKNPLSAAKALVQLGLRNPAEKPSHQRLAVIEGEITRMQKILLGYLASSRSLQPLARTNVDLGALVSDTLLVLSARADGARVRVWSRGGASVEGDPRRLKEALLNLVVNGIEATPPGGEVVVEVRPGDRQIEIAVHDTGHGMSPQTLRRLGKPFFTMRQGGTGLGVALARSVIAQHGGSLRYESAPGKGTTARATLPIRAPAA